MLVVVGQRRQTVAVGLGEELHATSLVQLLQLLDNLRGVHLQLLNTCTGEREGHLEVVAVLLDHLLQRVQGWHITTLCDIGDATLVLVVVIVIMIGTDIKETISFQMNNLMYLEI